MSEGKDQLRVFCFSCRTLLADEVEPRPTAPCPKCGVDITAAYKRGDEFKITAGGFSLIPKRPDGGRWESKSESKHSYFKVEGRNHFIERLIDRNSNRYRERIVDVETGEVVREIFEPLTSHQGRGTARTKRGRGSGENDI